MTDHLHIVSFDIPFPPDYGGIIDVYYKIINLYHQGIKIHLHCYYKDRNFSSELNKYCVSVKYYKRNTSFTKLLNLKPFITNSRDDKDLLANLSKDNYPILFEGLHTTKLLNNEKLSRRTLLVRTHNIEHFYYFNLAKRGGSSLIAKLYFLTEALKLKVYEKTLKHADYILSLKASDTEYFRQYARAITIPLFHSNDTVNKNPGTGNFILYHGNLSVPENDYAAQYLIKNVFSKTNRDVIIAGKNPRSKLCKLAERYDRINMIVNPGENELNKLISEARINTIISFNPSGVKVKLINALFKGGFCICNSIIAKDTGLEELTETAESPNEIAGLINKLFDKPPKAETRETLKRHKLLTESYSNKLNASKIAGIFKRDNA